MAMTNQQLYHAVENDTTITKEMTDIFVEFDSTASVSTQAELNSLLVKINTDCHFKRHAMLFLVPPLFQINEK